MATRQFDFINGPETSTPPTVGTPDSSDDLITLGFADDRYTQGGAAVADITALKAVASAERRDGDFFVVKSTNNIYRFDSASAVTGDDNFYLTPAVGSGRWVRITDLDKAVTFTDTTQSTTKDTGAMVLEGGLGVEKNLNVGGNAVITGNLTVSGTTTTINSTTYDVVDPNITVNKGGTTAAANTAVAGLTVENSGTSARFGYDSSLTSRFKAGDLGSESEIITAAGAQTMSGAKTFSTAVNITDTTQSTTKDTGSLILEGGLGVEKNINVGGNAVITGNLTVSGTTTTISSTTMDVTDPNITVNKAGSTTTANTAVAGITVETSGTSGRLGYDSTLTSRFKAGDSGSESEIITAAGTQTLSGAKTFSAIVAVSNTTQATNKDTGCVVLEGGLGVEKDTYIGGSLVVTGNVTVNGTTTTVNSTTLDVVDPNITVNKGGSTTTANSAVSGITVENSGTAARLGYDSTLASLFKAGTSGSESEIMTVGTTQTISGAKKFSSYADFTNTTAPATPSASTSRIYTKSDGKFYSLDSAGVERQLGGGGSGEKNYISDQDVIGTNWVASGAGVTVATSSTAAELPEESKLTGIKLTGVSGTDYARYRFTLDDSDKSKKLKIQFALKSSASYVSGDFKLEVYTNTTSNYLGTYTALVLDAPNIPANASGQVYLATFDTNTLDYYELRITRVTGTQSIVISGVVIGPGVQAQSAAVEEAISFTPSFTNLTVGNGTITSAFYRRVGSYMQIWLGLQWGSTTSVSGSIGVTVPGGFTMDSSKADISNGRSNLGGVALIHAGVSSFPGYVNASSTTSFRFVYVSGGAAAVVTATAPFTWTTNDDFRMFAEIPIAEWAGSGTINLSNNAVEYAFNTSVTDAADTTSFAYGLGGTPLPSSTFTANRAKRVRFTRAIQPSDVITLEVDPSNTGEFQPLSSTFLANGSASVSPFTTLNAASYGVGRIVPVNTTDVDVTFAQYASTDGATTYGGAGPNWNATTGTTRWRLKKSSGGVPVGFSTATSTSAGLLNYYEELTVSSVQLTDGSSNSLGATGLVDIVLRRIGKVVTMMVGRTTSMDSFGATTTMPTTSVIQTPSATVPTRFLSSWTGGYVGGHMFYVNVNGTGTFGKCFVYGTAGGNPGRVEFDNGTAGATFPSGQTVSISQFNMSWVIN